MPQNVTKSMPRAPANDVLPRAPANASRGFAYRPILLQPQSPNVLACLGPFSLSPNARQQNQSQDILLRVWLAVILTAAKHAGECLGIGFAGGRWEKGKKGQDTPRHLGSEFAKVLGDTPNGAQTATKLTTYSRTGAPVGHKKCGLISDQCKCPDQCSEQCSDQCTDAQISADVPVCGCLCVYGCGCCVCVCVCACGCVCSVCLQMFRSVQMPRAMLRSVLKSVHRCAEQCTTAQISVCGCVSVSVSVSVCVCVGVWVRVCVSVCLCGCVCCVCCVCVACVCVGCVCCVCGQIKLEKSSELP
jgi:hypothetical protein